jgi:hypothetical protein
MDGIRWLLRLKTDGACTRPMSVKVIEEFDGISYVRYRDGERAYMYDSRNIFNSRLDALRAVWNGFIPYTLNLDEHDVLFDELEALPILKSREIIWTKVGGKV